MAEYTKAQLTEMITGKLQRNFGRTVDEATPSHMFKACALVLRDIMSRRQMATDNQVWEGQRRQVHYLSLEFLMGRSLEKNAYNLGLLDTLKDALDGLGFSASDLFELEPDAGLGNGGLGRLAACYLDSMTTQEIPATGYSICYELGIFKQKIIDGKQVELADNWLGLGDAWLIPKMDEAEEVRFGGKVKDCWDSEGHNHPEHTGYTTVLAIPRDMEIRLPDPPHQRPAPVGRQKPRPRGHVPVLPGRVSQGGGAAGHGRGHRQGPLPRRQPLRGQVSALKAAVFLRLRHGAVHHP